MRILAENLVIEWVVEQNSSPLIERILWVDRPSRQVVVIGLAKGCLPIWKSLDEVSETLASGSAFTRPDPYAGLADPEEKYLQKHSSRRDISWNLIEELVKNEPDIYVKEKRGQLIREAVKKFGTSENVLYKLLRRYWYGGKTKNSLLPSFDKCGGSGRARIIDPETGNCQEFPKRGRPKKITMLNAEHIGINIDENIKTVFDCAYKAYFDTEDNNPLKTAFDRMLEKHFNVGTVTKNGVTVPVLAPVCQQPSYGQFRYWYLKQRDIKNSIIKRKGQKKFDLNSRPILGSSTEMAFGPGSIFQIDATIADVYLVSSLNRAWIIGRPVVYFIIDVFSRMVIGLYVGLEGPSWAGAMMAIANATTDKVSFCAEYGIAISSSEWPAHFLPAAILADRGELIGYNADNLADDLDIDVANCPPFRADLKGIVEQRFNRAKCKSIVWLPGAVHGREERGERDHRLDAALDLHEFTKIMILTALEYNQFHRMDWYEKGRDMIRDEIRPIPLELWEWGITHRTGHLVERSPEVIKLSLLPKGEATVTARGIKFEGAYFDTERALREQWYIKARESGTWKIPVSYDHRIKALYLRTRGGNVIEPCNLIERDSRFEGLRLEEIQQYFAMERTDKTFYEGTERQSSAELRAQTDHIITTAQELTGAAVTNGTSKRQRLLGIKTNRAVEKENNREREGFNLSQGDRIAPAITPPVVSLTGTTSTLDNGLPVTSDLVRRRYLKLLKEKNGADDNI